MNNISCINEECCGCNSCMEECPKGAITMKQDDEGFWFPQIDTDKCVNCGKCMRVCPVINFQNIKSQCHVSYLAYSTNKRIVKRSSSGGLFTVFASYILSKGGIVYGPAFNGDLDLVFTKITTIADLNKLVGSKYVQANTMGIYDCVKSDLRNGVDVLFSGTPCQIAGLKNFLKKDYNNLYTIDLLCHGVPSPGLFKKCVYFIENKYKCKVLDYRFRDKKILGWSSGSSSIIYEKKNRVRKLKYDNGLRAYFLAFINGLSLRNSCYTCRFSSFNRVGDLSLGDFWFADRIFDNKSLKNGVNLLIINTNKGSELLDCVKKEVFIEEVSDENALISNPHLNKPAIKPVNRDTRISSLIKGDYQSFIKYNIPRYSKLLPLYFKIKIFIRTIHS